MRSLFPLGFAGLIATSSAFAQTPALTPAPVSSGNSVVQDSRLTPSRLPAGTAVQRPAANNGPFRRNGLTPGIPSGGMNGPASGGGLVYDNGATDGSNGYSNIGAPVGSGVRRTLLDDFTLTGAADIGCVTWTHVWGNGEPAGTGVNAEIDLRDDAGGSPGAVFASANVTTYTEVETGGVFFSRPEIASSAFIDTVNLGAGTYWLEATTVDATQSLNNFWLIKASVTGSESWINYEDFGGLFPGSAVFGAAADLNFALFEPGAPPPPTCGDDLLTDNGAADGSNGYSNIGAPAGSGIRRTLLDDFNVPAGKVHDVTCVSWTHVWGNGEPAGTGIGADIGVRNDAGAAPGSTIATANVTAYSETETGGVFFSRPEISSVATFDAVNLTEGTYWLEATTVDASQSLNNFWLVRATVAGNECWINYEDFGGLFPGSAVFGAAADLNFSVNGIESTPPPPTVCYIYDNGGPDGANGYSNIGDPVGSGTRRTLLDDFTVPAGETWSVASLNWNSVHGGGEPAGTGIGADVSFRDDAGAAPGAVSSVGNVTNYTETETGGVFFSRPEVAHAATIDTTSFGAGTYWFEATMVGPTAGFNNFWLTATQQGNECWINYEDFGGLFPGSAVFGSASDINFRLGANRIGTNYCDALVNSTGDTGIAWATGSDAVADQNVTIIACDLPTGEFGYVVNSMNTGDVLVPNSGRLCLGDGKGRHVAQIGNSGSSGSIKTVLDLTALPRSSGGPATVQAGETWYFQLWHRDGAESNFTDAVCITFN